MKLALTLLVLVSTVHTIPVNFRFIFMPKLFTPQDTHENLQQQQQPEFALQSRSDAPQPSPFTFVEPIGEQPHPMAFPAQARMAVAPQQPFIPLHDSPTMQRRMDADEELLSQMPYSPQRRMDDDVIEQPPEIPAGAIPFVPFATREMSPPMPFFFQMPIGANEQHQQQQQQPLLSVSQPEGPPPMTIQLPIQKTIQMRALPFMPQEDEHKELEEDQDPEIDEAQDRDEIEEMEQGHPINVQSQRILVIESAQRLRPVVMDSLQTVMKIFNAVAPPEEETTTPAPDNVTADPKVEKLAQKLDRSLESLTMQVADALGTLTAHAKQLLPMLMKNNNTVSGIVEKNDTIEARNESPSVNEVKLEGNENVQNLTDTVSKFVQLNSDEFRRTWKHFLHHYWTYVQKILETAQAQ